MKNKIAILKQFIVQFAKLGVNSWSIISNKSSIYFQKKCWRGVALDIEYIQSNFILGSYIYWEAERHLIITIRYGNWNDHIRQHNRRAWSSLNIYESMIYLGK